MPFVFIYEDIDFDEDDEDWESKPKDFSYEKPELGDGSGCTSIQTDRKDGLWNKLSGKAVPSYLKLSDTDTATLKAFLPALKTAGVQRLFLSYDGGNDEGFGAIDRCETEAGEKITIDQLLADATFVSKLEPFVTQQSDANQHPVYYMDVKPRSSQDLIADYLNHELAVILVSLLLGRGYGTGEYELYGRAVADLTTMTITDDPDAPYPHGPSD